MIEPQFFFRGSMIYNLSDKKDPIARDKLKVHLRQPCRAAKNVMVDETYFWCPTTPCRSGAVQLQDVLLLHSAKHFWQRMVAIGPKLPR